MGAFHLDHRDRIYINIHIHIKLDTDRRRGKAHCNDRVGAHGVISSVMYTGKKYSKALNVNISILK